MEMAKSMMHEKGLSKNFSAEAVYTAVYLINMGVLSMPFGTKLL